MSEKKKTGLVIGKFNIFHYGHREMFETVSKKDNIEKIITAITSSPNNVFSWDERKEMLEGVLKEFDNLFLFYDVPDINNPPKYAEHVEKIIKVPGLRDVVLFTGNPYTINCFKNRCETETVRINRPYSATRILEMIGIGDSNWKQQVPKPVQDFIYKHNGIERIKRWYEMPQEETQKQKQQQEQQQEKTSRKFANPTPTTDIIIEYGGGIILIERKNKPYGWALPGGFHEVGLSSQENAAKEAKEETGLDIDIQYLLGVYSNPKRDPRLHTMSVTWVAKGIGRLQAGDDAKNARIFKEHQIPWAQLQFDHDQMLMDYYKKQEYKTKTLYGSLNSSRYILPFLHQV